MSKYLITPSLLGSYNWYISEFNNKPEARQEWLDRLGKIWSGTSEAAQKGIDFEDIVKLLAEKNPDSLNLLKGKGEDYIRCADDISLKVNNGHWQEKLTKTIDFQGNQYVLYGKSDVIKENTIYDIKTTKQYDVNKGYYQNNPQHAFYCYCADIPNFKYLVTDFKNVYEESYRLTQEEALERIYIYLTEFNEYLESDEEAKKLFLKHWKSKY